MRRRLLMCALLLLIHAGTHADQAPAQESSAADERQQAPPSAPPGVPYRLRTSVNRVQIPALILGKGNTPAEDLQANDFLISLDSGSAFHPTRSRVEGDDPISLFVLVDTGGSQPEIVAGVEDALSALAPDLLHPEDDVSIYAADCKMYRSGLSLPANSASIRLQIKRVFAAVTPEATGKHAHCGDTMHLWDWASYMFAQSAQAPGRRVAIILSGGHESRSNATLLEASRLAGHYAVTVFGIRDRQELQSPQSSRAEINARDKGEDRFELLCLSNGGLVLDVKPSDLQRTLARVLFLVRSRYILEFPRPDKGDPGLHEIIVTTPKNKHLKVHVSGTSIATSDPGLANDSSFIPSQASPATFGKRRPMDNTKH